MRILLSILFLLQAIGSSAQDMKEIIRTMPDSIAPLLTKNNRLDFIDYIEAGQRAAEKNKLTGESEMLKLNATRALIQMTAASTLDIKLISSPEPQIGIITTAKSDKAYASIVKYYSTDWKLLKTIMPDDFVKKEWNDDNEEITETRYEPLKLEFK